MTTHEYQELFVSAALDEEEARRAAQRALGESLLRPHDIVAAAKLAPAKLQYLPYWRIAMTAGSPSGPQREFVLVLDARRSPPLRTSPPTWRSMLDLVGNGAGTAFGTFAIDPNSLRPRSEADRLESAFLEPDISPDEARAAAERRLDSRQPEAPMRFWRGGRVLDLCHYPIYSVSYRYEGEVVDPSGRDYHVLVSGYDGHPLGGHHPSTVRSVARRIRGFLTFR